MSPVNHHIAPQLRHLIFYHLDSNLPRNALFFAGRLHAYEPRSSDAAYMLALCYLRLEQYKAAYDFSKQSGMRGTHLGCAYVFAQSCLALGKYPEGILALERSKGLWATRNNWNKHTESRRQHLPDAAAVYCLLGKLLHSFQDLNKATDAYVEALKLNPFMWDAFLALADLGATVKVQNIFKMTPEMLSVLSVGTTEETPLGTLGSFGDDVPQQAISNPVAAQPSGNDPFSISTNRVNNDHRSTLAKTALFEKHNGSSLIVTPIGGQNGVYDTMETPTAPTHVAPVSKMREPSSVVTEVTLPNEPPQAPVRKQRAPPAVDLNGEAPPRMKPSTLRSKTRSLIDTEDDTSSTIGSTITDRKRTASGKSADTNGVHSHGPSDPSAPQRRSARLFSQFSTRPQTTNKFSSITTNGSREIREGREIKKVRSVAPTKPRSTQSTVGRVVSGNRKYLGDAMDVDGKEQRSLSTATTAAMVQQNKAAANEKAKEQEALQTLFELFIKLGNGYLAVSSYRSHDAITILKGIPQAQRDTPWVLAQLGRAYYELAYYTEAEKAFSDIRTMAPSRMEDMELYSTILWHLKHEVDLAHLAHELVSFDRLSPQAWIAVGNSFSLQRDHDQALKCFKRATQLDPTFAYAFTLQGHEHIYNEEYDKAMASFRSGIMADNRHYNSWYGLAKVYEKQGKFDVAEHHYRTAASINPNSSVLLCCIGMVLEKQYRPIPALDLYNRSLEILPGSTLAMFKQARVMVGLGHNDKALIVLNELKDLAPDEANVHFLLGKVHKNLGSKNEAVKYFTHAMNLDPKASQYIKEAMESMEEDGTTDDEGYTA